MKFIAYTRHDHHYAYRILDENRNRLPLDEADMLKRCWEYIAEKKKEGLIEAVYFLHGHDDKTSVWIVNADSNEEMWSVLCNYPANSYYEINFETNILADAEQMLQRELKKVESGKTGAVIF